MSKRKRIVRKTKSPAPTIQITTDTLSRLVNKCYRLSYMVLMLEHICRVRKVQYILTVEEGCDVLQIKYEKMEEYEKKGLIRFFEFNGLKVCSAFDLVSLAEKKGRIYRRYNIRKLVAE